ncbi:kinase-like protein [Clavulina sp. PMI_390]|nr:kinase-like protein [Clavulina sp. PMI_390]
MIAVSPQLTVQVDMYSAILQSEQSRKEDRDQLLRELERIKSDSSAMMDLMTERSGKLDQESIDALQTLLHKIDHQPEKVLPAIRDFAEVATQTLKTQTNVDLPRRPPWLVSSKDFQKCEEFGRGRFSTMRKAIWRKSSMEVALKELEDREKLEGLFEDIVRWRELEHPCLHAFTAAQPIKLPRFFIYKFMPNGNVIDYLRANPKADTGLLLLHVALGMEYLHRHSVVHGNLNCHNILIDDQGMALVADFGISSHFPVKHEMMKPLVPEDEPRRWHTVNITGSLHWSAPETFELGATSTSSDVWSFAITAYEVSNPAMTDTGIQPTNVQYSSSQAVRTP